MKTSRLLTLIVGSFALLTGMLLGSAPVRAASPAAPGAGAPNVHQVVFELTTNQPEAWTAVLNNVENLRQAFGASSTKIEVVVHGNGLGFLRSMNTVLRPRMQTLADAGVVFAACENTMRRQHVTKVDLLPFATTVDSGVAEVVRRQEAGWSYIHIGG